MPCPRTPPPQEPNGYEKQTERFEVACTRTEKQVWQLVFGRRGLGDWARVLLNAEAYRLADIPTDAVFCNCKGILDDKARARLYAAAKALADPKPG